MVDEEEVDEREEARVALALLEENDAEDRPMLLLTVAEEAEGGKEANPGRVPAAAAVLADVHAMMARPQWEDPSDYASDSAADRPVLLKARRG